MCQARLAGRIILLIAGCGYLADTLAADGLATGQLRLRWEPRAENQRGPLWSANQLVPGTFVSTPNTMVADAEFRLAGHADAWGQRFSIGTNVLTQAIQPKSSSPSALRINELHLSAEIADWAVSAGKKVVGWDVGYGFRPNDLVQQEARRTLLGATPEGRPLVQVERFDAETAATLVWVNPQRHGAAEPRARGATESALAARWYQRRGSLDLHTFARIGDRTNASVGAAVAWVATDELEIHLSWRLLRRHEGWLIDALPPSRLVANSPWHRTLRSGTAQWLVGLNWTGGLKQSILIEAWRDGTTLSDGAWDDWTSRNQALAASSSAPAARAGNLAWQSTPFDSQNLRRDTAFVRVAWQPDHWSFTFDTLFNPADRGRILTAGTQWQGDRVRINAMWRVFGGPQLSVLGQIPQRRAGLIAATWAF